MALQLEKGRRKAGKAGQGVSSVGTRAALGYSWRRLQGGGGANWDGRRGLADG